jgi:WD40 repeat protein
MLILSAALALIPPSPPRPTAPPPHLLRGWVVRHTFTHKAPVTAVTATANGFFTGDQNGVILSWDAGTGRRRETVLDVSHGGSRPINAVRLAPGGKRLNVAINGLAGQVELTGTERTFYGPQPVWAVRALCSNGHWLASHRQELTVRPQFLYTLNIEFIRNEANASPVRDLVHPSEVRLAAPGRNVVVTTDPKGVVRCWWWTDTDAQFVWEFDQPGLGPTALALSPDESLVAVAGAQGTVEVRDTKKGRRVITLKGHTGAVRAVTFAPDSGLLATGGEDGTVRLWNPWTGEEEGRLTGHTGPLNAVWFASDDVLMSGSADKTARVWAYLP